MFSISGEFPFTVFHNNFRKDFFSFCLCTSVLYIISCLGFERLDMYHTCFWDINVAVQEAGLIWCNFEVLLHSLCHCQMVVIESCTPCRCLFDITN